ncbi:hypothetical protein RGR602_CH02344 [Rhizobium gallicum bv. gallicum R602sp]|uniref:Uncharacterized protein n=1 Tax=Rhizobium gallicum bv. gallicum R602sp TaxID=1041138 RepID=A0A0B4X4L6_9HYPH|nr:hypothetical protein [Rhizobium gallicum]AJD41670.1 hypothetical protein RGR602_CH02344 [Rhizobium gallicum bv. gallicum R602sp]
MTRSLSSSDVQSELLFAEDELFRGLRAEFVANLRRQLALGNARVSIQTLTPTGILMDYGRYHEDEVTTNFLAGAGIFEKTANGRRFHQRAAAPIYVVSEGLTPGRILVVSLRSGASGGLSVGLGTMPLVALVPTEDFPSRPSSAMPFTRH